MSLLILEYVTNKGVKINMNLENLFVRSKYRRYLKKFFRHKTGLIGGFLLFIFIFLAIFAPFISPYDPYAQNLRERFLPPSFKHLFGTDYAGRDIFTRIIYGARISLTIGFISVFLALFFGVLLGIISGYFGGVLDILIMRIIDIMLAFPSILLAIGIVAVLGPKLENTMIAVGIVSIPTFARIVRASVLSLKEKDFIIAAKAVGVNTTRIIFKHILPNIVAPIIVQATLGIASAILEAAGLSFLGLGAKPPTPEWGAMLSESRQYLRSAPWTVIFPGISIMSLVLAFNLFGDALRDILDPRSYK